eukprot:SAG25_NODE_490_length_7426_cov_3.764706_5_plen_75_part_00
MHQAATHLSPRPPMDDGAHLTTLLGTAAHQAAAHGVSSRKPVASKKPGYTVQKRVPNIMMVLQGPVGARTVPGA